MVGRLLPFRQMQSEFFHIDKEKIPQWTGGDLPFRLVADEAFARKSPVPVYIKRYMVHGYLCHE